VRYHAGAPVFTLTVNNFHLCNDATVIVEDRRIADQPTGAQFASASRMPATMPQASSAIQLTRDINGPIAGSA
jgi:hypothetical protein